MTVKALTQKILPDLKGAKLQAAPRGQESRFFQAARAIYGQDAELSMCPFTDKEIAELEDTDEYLVYLPRGIKAKELCARWNIEANIDFDHERMIRTVMNSEDQWFLASASSTPELIYKSGKSAQRTYEDEGLHGMDMRRYLAFAATHRHFTGNWPDAAYWTFLLSGSYDRSGVSIVGFDRFGVLSHHGWMKNFKSKFTGSRYIVIAPRIEITPATYGLPRARRGDNRRQGREADIDD